MSALLHISVRAQNLDLYWDEMPDNTVLKPQHSSWLGPFGGGVPKWDKSVPSDKLHDITSIIQIFERTAHRFIQGGAFVCALNKEHGALLAYKSDAPIPVGKLTNIPKDLIAKTVFVSLKPFETGPKTAHDLLKRTQNALNFWNNNGFCVESFHWLEDTQPPLPGRTGPRPGY